MTSYILINQKCSIHINHFVKVLLLYFLGWIWFSFVKSPKKKKQVLPSNGSKTTKILLFLFKAKIHELQIFGLEYCAFGTNHNVNRTMKKNPVIADVFSHCKASIGQLFSFKDHLAAANIWKILKIIISGHTWAYFCQSITIIQMHQ